jgi:hypothetical protein
MSKINFVSKAAYNISWLMKVNGVTLSNHCKKAFSGSNVDPFYYAKNSNPVSAELDYGVYYLCLCNIKGYHENIHIVFAVTDAPDENIILDTPLFSISATEAKIISFSNNDIIKLRGEYLFDRCRCWWFANKVVKHREWFEKNYGIRIF